MQEKRDNRLILIITIPIAIVFLAVLWSGMKDVEESRPRENTDTIQLVTLADSVHYYEDGM